MIKYHYAYDEDHHLVSINAIDKVSAKKHSYFCLSCGHELFPKLGEVRAHHFAHKKDVDCDGESYLHKLAKIKLKEKFDNKTIPFEIEFRRKLFCKDKDECPFYDEFKCQEYTTFGKTDLHKYYDTCVEEQTIYIDNSASEPIVSFEPKDESEKYIADLLLYDSKKKDRQPVLIEIYCSHKCEEKKTQSKLKIIEIHITSDEDIDKWIANTIVEDDDEYNELRTKEVEFMNFNPIAKSSERLTGGQISRFVYYSNDSSYVPNLDERIFCNKLHIKYSKYSVIELNIPCEYLSQPSPYEYGLVYLFDKGYNVRNCKLCKYYRDVSMSGPICCLYKKCNTPKRPKQNEAATCSYYTLNQKLIDELKDSPVIKKINEVLSLKYFSL